MQAHVYEGYYENGRVIPIGNPFIPENRKLVITVLDEMYNTQEKAAISRQSVFGSMKGKVWMAEDFDAPLDDFREYME